MAGPDLVTWDLTAVGPSGSGPFRLVVNHSAGSITEHFETVTGALVREGQLEALLMAARTAKSWPLAAAGAPDDEGSDGRPDVVDAADVVDLLDGGRLTASAHGTVLISADDAAPTILVVDDDQTVTETFAMALHRDGFTVRTARSAETGLREAEAHHADAIILDLRMPLINGLGFLYRLRRRREHEHTPVAIVTGAVVDDSTAAEISELGAEVRFKPLWLEDVVQLARDLVASAA